MATWASNGFSNGPQHTGLHANARRHTGESANSLLKSTVAHANARHCTVPVRLITPKVSGGGSARRVAAVREPNSHVPALSHSCCGIAWNPGSVKTWA